jgi:hypothetical protein
VLGGKPLLSQSEQQTERWFLLAWLLLTAWIAACALLIGGEYGDGYQTIVNARYFFADSPGYFVQRGPLAAVALGPVEFVVQALGLNPLDVRPYHFLSAAVHSAYLFGCWVMLRKAPGPASARLLAFATAILTVVFYAYAPYLSHDLLPGLLFLLMIFSAHRWLERQQLRDAVLLVALGAAVTLIKQTYAIFWVTIVAFGLLSCLLRWDGARVTLRNWLTLTSLAAASAVVSWLGYAWFIAGELPDESFLMRPVRLAAAISAQYREDLSGIFPAGIYLRNLHNYGVTAMLLVLPGVVMAFRGKDARMRMIAFCWLGGAVTLQLIGFREVRYLAFLAPLTAMLVVPVGAWLLRHKAAAIVLVGLVLFDQVRGLSTAAEQITTAPRSDVSRFITAPQGEGAVFASNILSFVYDATSPLRRDRYHGLYHLTPFLLHRLYEGEISVAIIGDMRELGMLGIAPGDRVYYANYQIVRRPPWQKDNSPVDIEPFIQVAGDATTIQLRLNGGQFERVDNDGSYVMLIPSAEVGQQMPVINQGVIGLDQATTLFGDIGNRESLEVTGVIVQALCQADACSYR